MSGYISIHRKLREHWLFKEKRNFSKFEAWIDILYEANHSDNKFLLGNQIVETKRGSTITSLRKLSEKWSWSITKVNSFLELLEKDEMLVVKKDTKKTLLTVVNYDLYQSDKWKKEHKKDTLVTPEENEKDTLVTRKETNNNDNNVNNDLIMINNENISYLGVKEKWNSCNELPKIKVLSKARKEKIRLRIGETSLEEFETAILELSKSDFATGKVKDKDGRSWKADIDWLISNDTNIIKVLEGKYSNKSKKKNEAQVIMNPDHM